MMAVTQIPLQPMAVVRNGKRITAIPEVNDLTVQDGTLYVLLYKIHDGHEWNLGWFTVVAPQNVIEYLIL